MQRSRRIVWLPVVLAASFPLGVLTAAAASFAGVSGPAGGLELSGLTPAAAPGPAWPPIPAAFTPEVQHWAPDIQGWAEEYRLPADLIATVIQIESCGHPEVVSPAGALGLFQVMPFHFAAGEDPFSPQVNAARGLRYLARGYELAGGEARQALAGYNGGHGMIGRAPALWPEETRRYVAWGTQILSDIDTGTLPSPGVAAWLEAGGASLCRQAADALGID